MITTPLENMLKTEFHLTNTEGGIYRRESNGWAVTVAVIKGSPSVRVFAGFPGGHDTIFRSRWVDIQPFDTLSTRLVQALAELFAPMPCCDCCGFPSGHTDGDTFPWRWELDFTNGQFICWCPLCFDPSRE